MTRKQFHGWRSCGRPGSGPDERSLETELKAQGLTRQCRVRIEHFLAVPTILSQSDLIFTVPYAIGAESRQARGHQARAAAVQGQTARRAPALALALSPRCGESLAAGRRRRTVYGARHEAARAKWPPAEEHDVTWQWCRLRDSNPRPPDYKSERGAIREAGRHRARKCRSLF